MKITIEPETTQEQEQLKAPIVRTGVEHLVVSGRVGADSLYFHSAGDLADMIGGMTATIERLRHELGEGAAVRGVIAGHNMIARAQQNAAMMADVRNGKNLRIHRL